MNKGNGEKTKSIHIYESDKQILEKIKDLHNDTSVKVTFRRMLEKSEYTSQMDVIDEKYEELLGYIPEKVRKKEMDKLKRLKGIFKQVVADREDIRTEGYRKLFEHTKKKEEMHKTNRTERLNKRELNVLRAKKD